MEFLETLHSRRSIRAFTDREVEQETLDAILSDAIESPSSSNTQPFKLAVATGATCQQIGEDLLNNYKVVNKFQRQPALLKLFNFLTSKARPDGDYVPILGKYPGIFQERRIHTGRGLYEIWGIKRGDRKARDASLARNFTFFNAPVAIFVFLHTGMKHTAFIDTGIMMQSLMLSATARGLGTCAQGSLGMWRSPLENHFNIPQGYKLVCGISLGYPDDSDPANGYRPKKISLDELLIESKS